MCQCFHGSESGYKRSSSAGLGASMLSGAARSLSWDLGSALLSFGSGTRRLRPGDCYRGEALCCPLLWRRSPSDDGVKQPSTASLARGSSRVVMLEEGLRGGIVCTSFCFSCMRSRGSQGCHPCDGNMFLYLVTALSRTYFVMFHHTGNKVFVFPLCLFRVVSCEREV